MAKDRNKSIIHEQGRCWVCGCTGVLHTHEVFGGTANRKKSIKYGLYVDMCPIHHNIAPTGVHFNKELDRELKQLAQRKFEEIHGHEKFMSEFHKNYL